MKSFCPLPPWPFGPKRPEFYLCHCENCGFTRTYEVSDCEVISRDGAGTDTEAAFVQVKSLPKSCPQCGGKWKKTKIPSPVKY